jgi:tetratricopeptide (TPR) repeat protein
MKDNPYPSLHLAKLFQAKKESDKEKEFVEKALAIDPGSVDGWAYLYQCTKAASDEDKAIAELEGRAKEKKNPAPYIALQGFFAGQDETRDKAIDFAKKALDVAPDEPIALLCLSALYGQKGDLEAVVKLLQPHEGKMSRDVRLANNYFEALFQLRQIEKVTKLLNALMGSPSREVKQYAMERSKVVAQYLQQQQAQLAQGRRT